MRTGDALREVSGLDRSQVASVRSISPSSAERHRPVQNPHQRIHRFFANRTADPGFSGNRCRCWSDHTAALSRVRKGCQQRDCEWRFITGDAGYLGRPTQVDEGPLATGGNANSRERSRSDRHHYGAQQLRCAALLGRSGLHLACVCRLGEAASHNVSSCSKRLRLWNFNFAEVACRIAQPQEPLP